MVGWRQSMSIESPVAAKHLPLPEIVRRHIPHGAQLGIGGFTVSRNPMAMIHEIIRQSVRDLHLVCHSNGQALDLLVGAGCVRRVELAYAGNGRYAPTCIRFRRAMERGELECEDYSNLQMALRFLAGSLGLPFIPSPSGQGSDILNLQGFCEATRQEPKVAPRKWSTLNNPFSSTKEATVVLPALTPDVVILHAQVVGADGSVRIDGLKFADVEQARAAQTLIVTAERMVPSELMRCEPDRNVLPGFMVDAFSIVPFGAHPTSCFGEYDVDPQHLARYRAAASDDVHFDAYLRQFIYETRDHPAYLERIGENHLESLRADPHSGYATGLNRK
jgi:glutaconate CoA-transferase subunit A